MPQIDQTQLPQRALVPPVIDNEWNVRIDASAMKRWSRFVAAKEIAVKKYVVRLSAEERERLETLVRSGKHSARTLTRARILLKADAGEGGEAWSDSQIAKALDTSLATIARTRQQLVEEGFDAVLTRKHSPASARPRIFDGAAEAKLIALACSEPPKGRARWTLSLLEDKVVELNIVAKASDNTIGRTLKKTFSNRI
jgi:transposase